MSKSYTSVPLQSAYSIAVKVDKSRFDIAVEIEKMRQEIDMSDVGAIASFLGLCRDEGGQLAALEIEHFPIMAEQEITSIAKSAGAQFPLSAVRIIHRYGRIETGEEIVLVLATSSHRTAAFEAVRWIMDCLKTDAPFWKKQHWHNPSNRKQQSDWVEANPQDVIQRLNHIVHLP